MITKLATFTEHRTRILRPFPFLAHMKGGNDMTILTPKERSMFRLARHAALGAAVALAALVAPSTPVAATSEVFLSNDVALSKVTYIVQFDTTVTGKIGKIRVLLPSGSNAGNARPSAGSRLAMRPSWWKEATRCSPPTRRTPAPSLRRSRSLDLFPPRAGSAWNPFT
jgi:hypothetical protein